MRDMLEQLEDMAERRADESMSSDEFRCACGKWSRVADGMVIHANPYAPLFCRDCSIDAINEAERCATHPPKLWSKDEGEG